MAGYRWASAPRSSLRIYGTIERRGGETGAADAEVGVERIVCAMRYQDARQYRTGLDALTELAAQ